MKKTLSIILSLCMLLSITAGLNFNAFANATGKCGDKVTYSFNSSTGVLTLSGSGETNDYDWYKSPFSYYESDKPPYAENEIGNDVAAKIKTVVVGEGITSIGESLFYQCAMESVSLPNSLTKIGKEGFSCCFNLKSVKIPDKIDTLENYTFYRCENMESVALPKSLKKIASNSFGACDKLKTITISSENTNFAVNNNVLYDKDFKELIYYAPGKSNKTFTVPDGVETINSIYSPNLITVNTSNSVKRICSIHGENIESINLNEGLQFIESSAFSGENKLTEITIPSTVEQIGYDSIYWQGVNVKFAENTDVKMIGMAEQEHFTNEFREKANENGGAYYIGPYLIYVDDEVSGDFKVKDGTIGIAAWAFDDCTKITSIEFPDSLKYISYGAFCRCSGLTEITFPESVEYIFEGPFHNCDNLKEVTVLNPLCKIDICSIDGNYASFIGSLENVVFKGYTGSTLYSYYQNHSPYYWEDNNNTFESIGTYNCDHDWVFDWTRKPDKDGDGYDLYVCTKCDMKEKRNIKKYVHSNVEPGEIGGDEEMLPDYTVTLSQDTYTYNRKVKRPAVTVTYKDGTVLTENTDYTLTYAKGRKYVGKYAVTVDFIGDYSGSESITAYFTIKPKGTTLKKLYRLKKGFKANWKKQRTQTSGYQLQYSRYKSFKKSKKVTVKGNKKTLRAVKKLSKKKYYYVRIRTYKTVNGEKIYSSWSKAKKVKTR